MKKRVVLLLLMAAIMLSSATVWAQESAGSIKKMRVVPSWELPGKVYLMWEQIEDTFYYKVYRDGKVVGRARDPFYVDKTATAGVKAVYKVVATKGGKDGASSAEIPVKLPATIDLPKEKIEFRGDDIYVNGEKYIVCGIGYAPYRPHTSPNKPYPRDYDVVEKDFQLMKKIGFNTIRNWSGRDLDEYMMELAHKYGLLIIQGMSIWVPPMADFSDKSFWDNSISTVEDEMKINREHGNIIGYLLMNEPPPGKIAQASLAKTNEFYDLITAKIKELQPGAYISLANWPRSDMLSTKNWDFICINHYGYDKSHVVNMGYRGYLGWMERSLAKDKPLIGTEYGYSMSKRGEGKFGYGGNTEDEQATGIVNDTYAMIAEKGNGACIFSWIDEWWKNNEGEGDEDRHEETEPEEWFGIVAMPDDVKLAGSPRKAASAMEKFYEALVISPRDANKIQGTVPVEVYTKTVLLPNLAKVEYSIDDSNWVELSNTANWWRAELDTVTLGDGKYDFKVRYTTKDGKEVVTKQPLVVYIANNEQIIQQELMISTDQEVYKNGDTVTISIQYSENGQPAANKTVSYAVTQIGTITASCRNLAGADLVTDNSGVVKAKYVVKDEERPHFLTISAAVPSNRAVGQKFAERIVVEVNQVVK
ncbi:MAG: glycoside hydrolase family 2 TIM barrel-domain containing protein [bacterium]|nr:glycoside hydrolase family 2 TIM barrel-domain containing protein [bacterium]MDD5353571.1 glycoside hydrolase family 2 TIM barrel-domain containing protein [bacterium]MDD5756452.1 glycoside hydrolase family 2 TIM barrel-domain containing protein [bacterium]